MKEKLPPLLAYSDESGMADDTDMIAIGSVIANHDQWAAFDIRWRSMLKIHSVPHIHMREIIKGIRTGRDPFGKFQDPRLLDELLKDATFCITDAGVYCCSCSLFSNDLLKTIEENRLEAEPYPFTLYLTVNYLGTWALNKHPGDPRFKLTLDRLEKSGRKVRQAKALYESDNFMSWRGWPEIFPLSPKSNEGSHEDPRLQAADLVAWAARRRMTYEREWLVDVKPTLPEMDFNAWDESIEQYVNEKFERGKTAFPAENSFYLVQSTLSRRGFLKHFTYDEERLRNHVMAGRSQPPDTYWRYISQKRAKRPAPLEPI